MPLPFVAHHDVEARGWVCRVTLALRADGQARIECNCGQGRLCVHILDVLARTPGIVEYHDSFVLEILKSLSRSTREAISQYERTADQFERVRLLRGIGNDLAAQGVI